MHTLFCSCWHIAVFTLCPRLYLAPDVGYSGELQRLTELFITRTVTHDSMRVSPEVGGGEERGAARDGMNRTSLA
jgi:hypothetical protein